VVTSRSCVPKLVAVSIFIYEQGEDDTIPFPVPRQTIEANPYTTAIVAQSPTTTSIPKKKTVKEPGSASRHDWSHTIALEVNAI
jgi:hypothetical protein